MSGNRPAPFAMRIAILGAALAAAVGAQKPSAVIAGTVFREPGLAMPEAKVALLDESGAKPKKVQEAITNYRGEFAFHVPAREAKYVLKATMKGYRPEEKPAKVSGEDRIDVNLVLAPEKR